jgi:hypothetical protein
MNDYAVEHLLYGCHIKRLKKLNVEPHKRENYVTFNDKNKQSANLLKENLSDSYDELRVIVETK